MPIGCTLPGLIRRPTVHVLPKPTPAVEVELIAAIFNYLHLQISSSLSSSAANAHWLYRLSLLLASTFFLLEFWITFVQI